MTIAPRTLARRGLFGMAIASAATTAASAQSQQLFFTPGNVVVAVEGCGVAGGTCSNVPNGTGTGAGNSASGGYGDNQAAPLTLFQYTPNGATSAAYQNSLVLPQTAVNNNLPVSGEYGSSSEGTLQLSAGGQYLTIAGYGVNAATFDANPTTYGAAPSNALAQSGSLTGQSYTPVAREVNLIDPYGNVNSSSGVFNIFSTNNPRSVAVTADGQHVYLSGQGVSTDTTGGVFYAPLFATTTSPTAITGADNGASGGQDTRSIQIYNGTLYVSVDSKSGSTNRSFLGTLGKPPATSLYNGAAGPAQLAFSNNAATPVAVTSTGKLTLTASETNGINTTGQQINLSASNFFFANASTLYIADTGNSKQTSATSTLGDGGLQKWVNTKADGSGTWQLQYTVSAGLNLVANTNTTGSSGLYGLAGVVSGTTVYLYATNATLNDLDATYLYGFSDVLSATTRPANGFVQLAAAPSDSNFKGVSMAPTLTAGSATITSSPSGLAISTSGTGCAAGTYITPVTLLWTPGSSCQISTAGSQTVNGSTYSFYQFGDGTTATTDTVTAPSSSAVYTASFADATVTTVQQPNPTSTAVGAATTLTATVVDSANAATLPAGAVTFSSTVGGRSYTLGTAPVTGGTATLNYTAQYGGSNTVTASFTPTSAASFAASADATGKALTVAAAAQTPTNGFTYSVVQGASTIFDAITAYPGTVSPTGAVTATVNGSSSGLSSPSCVYKVKHSNCALVYSATLAPGTYQVIIQQAADSNYMAVTTTATVTVTAPPASQLKRPSAPVRSSSRARVVVPGR